MKKYEDEKSFDQETSNSNPIMANIVKMIFEVVKYIIHNSDTVHPGKKNNELKESLESINNVLLKLEQKVHIYQQEIVKLKNRLLWTNIIFIMMLIILIGQIILR